MTINEATAKLESLILEIANNESEVARICKVFNSPNVKGLERGKLYNQFISLCEKRHELDEECSELEYFFMEIVSDIAKSKMNRWHQLNLNKQKKNMEQKLKDEDFECESEEGQDEEETPKRSLFSWFKRD
jgi:hypothetical protein